MASTTWRTESGAHFSAVSYLFGADAPEDTPSSMNRNNRSSAELDLRLVDARSAAALLGVSRWTVYHWARTRLLGSVRLGRRRLFELNVLEDFVRRGRDQE